MTRHGCLVLFFIVTTSCVWIGQCALLLPSIEVVAVSQDPSPESNPNALLPVTAVVVQYPTTEG